MKQFTNKKGDSYLFVEVPNNTYKCTFYDNVITARRGFEFYQQWDEIATIKGNYELIGLAKDVIEEVAESIVDSVNDEGLIKYFNYIKQYYSHSLFSPTESFQSLLQSLGLKTDYTLILKVI